LPTSTVIQIVAACTGVLGSMFFAIGVMRQTVTAMADLAGSYFEWNPHMVTALAAQKADYLFGGGIIFVAFALQLFALLVPPGMGVEAAMQPSNATPWIAVLGTAVLFPLLRLASKRLSRHFEAQIWAQLKRKDEILKRELEERQRALTGSQLSI
jgi:sterol desaturase/sphingolipid hydroxylase (fatty acid hydroxylase superfamily)